MKITADYLKKRPLKLETIRIDKHFICKRGNFLTNPELKNCLHKKIWYKFSLLTFLVYRGDMWIVEIHLRRGKLSSDSQV